MRKFFGVLVALLVSIAVGFGVVYFFSGFHWKEPVYDASSLLHLTEGQPLTFVDGQNNAALLSGWSGPEPKGVWSDGHAAYLGFNIDSPPTADANTPTAVVLETIPFLAGKLTSQNVYVWANGTKVGEQTLTADTTQIRIPLTAANAGKPLIIGLHLPDATSPKDLDVSADARVLGVFLKSATVQ